jgi:hypothetical protein
MGLSESLIEIVEMTEQVKIRLKAGNWEIEIEGPRSDVDELLDRWWAQKNREYSPPTSADKDPEDHHGASGFDPNRTANEIKQRPDLATVERKIIQAHGSYYEKIAFVLSVVDAPLTSGQIHKTLEALDIRISLPNVSSTLKRNMSKFLTSAQRRKGGEPPTYRLTAQAKSDLEKWLANE